MNSQVKKLTFTALMAAMGSVKNYPFYCSKILLKP